MSARPAPEDEAPAASPVLPEAFDSARRIRFECRRGIACWNAFCANADVPLTPYDVLRLKRRFGLASGEFLRAFTFPYEMEKDGLVGVKLKPVEGGTACRFMTEAGCSVYEDRPTACRYYPVALLSMRKQGESAESESYALVKEPHCLGHEAARSCTVAEYRREQGLEEYDAGARGWRQLVLKKKSLGPAIGRVSPKSLELFFMACYDLDRFRAFVTSAGFSGAFELSPAESGKLASNDEDLLAFAYRLLRQVLFGESTIALRPGRDASRA